MHVEQSLWTESAGWRWPAKPSKAALALVFAGSEAMGRDAVRDIAATYPEADVVGCTTAGEIEGTRVRDESIVVTAIRPERARTKVASIDLQPDEDSAMAGLRLARRLPTDGLVHVLVLSDGQHVNGSALVAGMQQGLPAGVRVTGGLAGDGARFQRTLLLVGRDVAQSRVLAVGFYGPLQVGYGSLGGWDPFGPQRRITKSAGNVLYELDGQPALGLYKRYLGEHVAGLPATGLLFPLALQTAPGAREVVRTILGVDEGAQSMTFAGDLPEGTTARLMKANFDRLIDGAQGAARGTMDGLGSARPELAILISCVGRKLVLKQRIEEEVERVRDVLGPQATLAGFYSYGEICPAAPQASCELHNQTMTITTFRES